MKTIKLFLAALLLFVAVPSFSQMGAPNNGTNTKISSIKIKSKIPLMVDTRTQVKDTVYVTIDKWIYDARTSKYIALVVDYTKDTAGNYKEINKKTKIFSKTDVNNLFTYLGNPILVSDSYSDKMDAVLIQGLFIDTQTNLLPDGHTIYGGLPANWEIVNSPQ